MSHAFEQQPREGAKAFAAFKEYLDMGPDRSFEAVARKLTKSSRLLKRWSAKFDWAGRVAARDSHFAEMERQAIERLACQKAVEWWQLHEPTRRQAWLEAEEAIRDVQEARRRWRESGRVPGFEGMARMLELAFKLKQFAAGMPNEVKEVNTNIHATIDVDWEIAIRKAYPVAVVAAPQAIIPDGQQSSPAAIVDVEAVPAVEAKP